MSFSPTLPFGGYSGWAFLKRTLPSQRATSNATATLKRDEDYKQVFDASRPLAAYVNCVALAKRVEAHLRASADMTPSENGNIRFHVAMAAAMLACQQKRPSFEALAKLDVDTIDDSILCQARDVVLTEFRLLGGTDTVAKGADFLTKIKHKLDSVVLGNDYR